MSRKVKCKAQKAVGPSVPSPSRSTVHFFHPTPPNQEPIMATTAPTLAVPAATVPASIGASLRPHRIHFQPHRLHSSLKSKPLRPLASAADAGKSSSPAVFHGECFVVGDNIDTDQIIPAEHLTLVPSKPDEYRKLGSYAFCGLPVAAYPTPFVDAGADRSRYAVVVGGANFGCGSSREHAPVALGAAGARAIVAESYARIFFRNSVATGEVYPVELADAGAWRECRTGDVVTVDLDTCVMVNHTSGKEYKLKPIGDAGPVIEAGGIFAYARKTGMIASASPA